MPNEKKTLRKDSLCGRGRHNPALVSLRETVPLDDGDRPRRVLACRGCHCTTCDFF